jgi:hypothetical protein
VKRDTEAGVERLPRNPKSGEALRPGEQPGYYPGFSTLAQQDFWDAATRKVVVGRVDSPPSVEYFDQETANFWTHVFEHLIPQDDRTAERRIPIVNVLDRRLHRNQTAGYRFSDMPSDRVAYRLGQTAIEEEAQAAYDAGFLDLSFVQQDVVLRRIHDGEPRAAAAIWQQMSVHRFWGLIMGDAVDAYYAHPWSWDEIGFGGPAYPRAYTRLERGDPEPWEVREQRYDWLAPVVAVSDEVENAHEFHLESEQHRSHAKKPTRS